MSLSEFSYCEGGSASGDLFLVGHLDSATVRECRVEDWLCDRYGSSGHVAEFEYELVEFLRGLEDHVGRYGLVFLMPDIDWDPRPGTRNILYSRGPPHQVYRHLFVFHQHADNVVDLVALLAFLGLGHDLDHSTEGLGHDSSIGDGEG